MCASLSKDPSNIPQEDDYLHGGNWFIDDLVSDMAIMEGRILFNKLKSLDKESSKDDYLIFDKVNFIYES